MRNLPTLRAALAAIYLVPLAALAGDFKLAFIDVGQGDAAVVIAPSGCAAVFDGGPTGSGADIKAYLRAQGVTHVDMVITSHYHADHLGGLDEINQGTDAVTVSAVYDRGSTYSSTAYTQYANQYAGKRHTLARNQVLSLCNEVTFKVVAVNANGISTSDENAKSVAIKISYGAFDALIGGDLPGESPNIEQTLVGQVGEVEVYKVHHHGSMYSSTDALLNELRPTVSVISVGVNNTYGHPTPEAIARLRNAGSAVYQTEDPATGRILGNVLLNTATGAFYVVAQGGSSTSYASKGGAPLDTTAPTAPGALVATPAGTSGIDLSWDASTDNVGVTSYRVFRSSDGSSFTLAGTSTTTGFADTGLPSGATRWYRVSALDAAGNESAFSNTAQATTGSVDAQPPTVPAGLTASASSPTQVNLSWTASSDDVGVAAYDVYRSTNGSSFALATSTAATSFADGGRTSGTTYWYKVRARDAAGNVSADSNVVQATTPAAQLTVTSPNGGESIAGGTTRDITWTSSLVANVKLEYSLDNGGTWTVIASSVAASAGRYSWAVPNSATTAARVRASDAQAGTPSDTSDGAFTITTSSPGKMIINEILANEPGSATGGEFIEVVNVGGQAVDISGWTLWDSSKARHTFAAGTIVPGGKAIVVFGSAAYIPGGLGNAVAASTGDLNLVNSGEQVSLRQRKTKVDTVTYSSTLAGQDGVSANRSPDATAGAALVLHTTLSAAASSPGTRANGAAY